MNTDPVTSAHSLPSPTDPDNSPPLWKGFLSLMGIIASKGKNLFSITALLAVIYWAFCGLNGYVPNDIADKILSGGIVVLMIFEIWKTTATHQINKRAFLMDLVTGILEFSLFWVVAVQLIIHDQMDYSKVTNYAMAIFVAVDAILVPYNRYVLILRQITSVTDGASTDHHQHHAAGHALHHEHHSS